MDHCDHQLLSAYLDGEVAVPTRLQIESHVDQCEQCANELEKIRSLSKMVGSYNVPPLTADELERIHDAVDDENRIRLYRPAGLMGLIAASILVISGTWLAALPAPAPAAQSKAKPADWERVAMTLQAEAVPVNTDQTAVADAAMADWMLRGLSPKNP